MYGYESEYEWNPNDWDIGNSEIVFNDTGYNAIVANSSAMEGIAAKMISFSFDVPIIDKLLKKAHAAVYGVHLGEYNLTVATIDNEKSYSFGGGLSLAALAIPMEAFGTGVVGGGGGAGVLVLSNPATLIVAGVVVIGITGYVGYKYYKSAREEKATNIEEESKWPGDDAKKAPDGTEWRGKAGSKPGDGQGNYHDPETGESYRPDLEHKDPVGPHWDYRAPGGQWYRIKPDGTILPK